MSGIANVLVGILGGTMTIGLSMAGGSALAPRLDEVRTTSEAAMVLTAVRQTGQAVAMAKTLGEDVPVGMAGVDHLVKEGWLSSVPRNPTNDQPSGAATVMPSPDGTSYIQMNLIGDKDGRLCDTVARMSGLGEIAPGREAAPLAAAGCVRTSGGSVAFVRS